MITPRELFDAAVKAGLPMPGFDRHVSEVRYPIGMVLKPPIGAIVDASLADVEAAVMEGLAAKWPTCDVAFSHGWQSAGVTGIVAIQIMRDGLPPLNAEGPTRAAALKSACEALAKEAK